MPSSIYEMGLARRTARQIENASLSYVGAAADGALRLAALVQPRECSQRRFDAVLDVPRLWFVVAQRAAVIGGELACAVEVLANHSQLEPCLQRQRRLGIGFLRADRVILQQRQRLTRGFAVDGLVLRRPDDARRYLCVRLPQICRIMSD